MDNLEYFDINAIENYYKDYIKNTEGSEVENYENN